MSDYDFDRLSKFLNERRLDIYKEPNNNIGFIEGAIDQIKDKIKEGDRVLDVGCGHGKALEVFTKLGAKPIGITLSEEDKEIAEKFGEVKIMDMSFMDFKDEEFDVVFARHSLEHSIFPFFTLAEMFRVLKKGGIAYFEMPGENTEAGHESNLNHYSIFGGTMWYNLLHRVGFKNIEAYIINFMMTIGGEDYYLRFITEK